MIKTSRGEGEFSQRDVPLRDLLLLLLPHGKNSERALCDGANLPVLLAHVIWEHFIEASRAKEVQ